MNTKKEVLIHHSGDVFENGEYSVYYHSFKDRIYIGITKQRVVARWGKGGIKYKGCTKFWNAIKKYGWDSFSHHVIVEGVTKEHAERYEQELIAMFRTSNLKVLNLSSGGSVNSNMSDEVKQRMSKSQEKAIVQLTKEYELVREWDGAVHVVRELGLNNTNISSCISSCIYGRRKTYKGFVWMLLKDYAKLTDEEKHNRALDLIPNYKKPKTRKYIEVIDKSTGKVVGTYKTANEIAEAFNVTKQAVSYWMSGKTKSSYEFRKYVA